MVNTSMFSFVDGVDSSKLMTRQTKTVEAKPNESFASKLEDASGAKKEEVSATEKNKPQSFEKTEEAKENPEKIAESENVNEVEAEENDIDETEANEEAFADEEIKEYVDELVELMQKVADIFGTTIQDLSDTLKQLDMQMSDITSVEGMNKLVLQMNDSKNPIELLINPEMSRQMKELMNAVENFNEEVSINSWEISNDVNLKENIDNAFLEKISESTKLVDVENEKIVSDEKVVVDDVRVDDSNETPELDYGKTEITENNIDISKTTQDSNENSTDNNSGSKQGNMAEDNLNQTTISGGFVENITNSITEALGDNFNASQTESIVRQVIEQIKVTAREDFSSIEINLNPENLGKVGISVASKNGVLTAQISVETEAAKSAIESQIAVLKDTFNEQGIKIQDVEITLASHQFERDNESESRQNDEQKAKKTARRIRLDDLRALNGEEQVEEIREENNRILMGNTVSYLA